uniref:MAM domain-containing protein n=1 Tax=Magallana gigas TaxID=29159 RepID=A0A8W8K4X3_MAGGI
MGELIQLIKDCKTNSSVEIWKMSGDQGDKWNEACVLLEQGGHNYIPQSEALRGPSYHSDIGIDDIEFRTGQCFGSYIFVETSGGSPGLKGSFLSPQLPSNQEACLHFWYNMNGAEMGNLDVIIQSTTGNGTTILHEFGNKGTRWFEAKMTIPSQTQPYKIDFQVTRGSGFKGDAALDDISIKDGPCV